MSDLIIIGAGLTGLSFAFHRDKKALILEKENAPGGLVRTLKKDGYYFDLAPHLIHLRSDYVKNLLTNILKLNLNKIDRVSNIYFENKFIPYPFELSLYHVSEKVKDECLKTLGRVKDYSEEELKEYKKGSYSDYAYKCFGSGIADNYLLPYNKKIWSINPSEMTCEWMKFLPTPNKQQINEYSESENKEKFGYNTQFYYPFNNGIQELSDKLAEPLSNIRYNHEVVSIDSKNKIVTTANGEKYHYSFLVSTLPLKKLIEISDLECYRDEAKNLKNTSVYVVNLVVKGKSLFNQHWTYFPGSAFTFYRISYPKSYFNNATPSDNEFIISVEVSSQNDKLDIKSIEDKVQSEVFGIKNYKIEKINFIFSYQIDVAYSIYDFNRTSIVNLLQQKLREKDIYSVGRYGNWEYSAMEDAILYGKKLAEIL